MLPAKSFVKNVEHQYSQRAFLRRAGTVILATMVVVWAALYFPTAHPDGGSSYPERIAAAKESEQDERANELEAEWKKGRSADLVALARDVDRYIDEVSRT